MTIESPIRDRRRFKLIIEFDGTDFSGWQRQGRAVRTVQGEIENAIAQILQQKVTVIGSGRTDAGVHALAQVAHSDLILSKFPLEKLHFALNSLLPGDVQVLSLEETSLSFHARFQALSRSYRYRVERRRHPLLQRFSWTPPYAWDDDVIGKAVQMLPGRHSFKSFCLQRPGEDGYFCTVKGTAWEVDENGVNFLITADRFLHKMVRGLVGALIDVGRGRYTLDDFRDLLDEPVRNGAVSVAPPHGLTLLCVDYPL